jgi:hypothetical protein
MKPIRLVVVALAAFFATSAFPEARSGPLGFYGLIERVVFEPNQAAAERVQLWGAFTYVNGLPGGRYLGLSTPKRGYLYFKTPEVDSRPDSAAYVKLVKAEWADLAAVAGTGQAVGFGRWGYAGAYELPASFEPGAFERILAIGAAPGLRVRDASEAPAAPAVYLVNTGVVRLSATGAHAELVAALTRALAR